MGERTHLVATATHTHRRRFLAVGGGFALAALAGCQQVLLDDGWAFPDGSPPVALRDRTTTFVERVEDGDYEAATEPFTAELAGELPQAELESTWADNVGHLGTYQEIGQWGHREGDELDRVFARVEREEGHYDLQLTFDTDRQIAGVFIRDVVGR